MPGAGVQAGQLGERVLARGAFAVGGALKRRIVHQDRDAIAAEFGVKFGHVVAVGDRRPHACQGVFRGRHAAAPVGDKTGVRPGRGVGHSGFLALGFRQTASIPHPMVKSVPSYLGHRPVHV